MRLFLKLAGVDDDVLANCWGERHKLAAMGATVAVTAFFATAAATFTVVRFVHTSLTVGLLAGLVWGTAILVLDRWLVISIRRQRSRLATFLLSLPRVLLACIVGLAIAPPVQIKMFENEVTARAVEERQQVYQTGKQALDRRFSEIAAIEGDVGTLTRKIGTAETGANLVSNPAYRAAVGEVSKLHTEAQAASGAALCELDGTCGTRHVGAGQAYTEKAARASSLDVEAAAAQRRADQLRHSLLSEQSARAAETVASERRELSQSQTRLDGLRSERAQLETRLRRGYERPIGLADRLDALSALERSHPSVARWSWIIALLIIFIDTAPALSKAFLAVGDPTLYELEQERAEEFAAKKSQLRTEFELEAERIDARRAVDEAKLKRRLWKAEMEDIVAKQVAAEAELARLYISTWEAMARKQAEDWVREMLRSNWPATPGEDGHGQGAARAKHARGVRSRRWNVRWRRR